jgi:hypothetical protein
VVCEVMLGIELAVELFAQGDQLLALEVGG